MAGGVTYYRVSVLRITDSGVKVPGMVRPLKNDGEPLDQRMTLKLSKHQMRVLDVLVEASPEYETRQDLVRDLVKRHYIEMVKKGMDPIVRAPEHVVAAAVPAPVPAGVSGEAL